MDEKYDFNDILILPAKTSLIESRKEVNPYLNDFLPLITAPMDTVINSKNKSLFENLGIISCLPRGEKIGFTYGFESMSLIDMKMKNEKGLLDSNGNYLIDVANGHMASLVSTIKTVKIKYPNIVLMVGNIANPETYCLLSEAGADFIRVGIGAGAGCTSSVHTGVGFPMASLIAECYSKSLNYEEPAYIVADGGMQNYGDIIKALALGADYVMVGSLFNKSLESCGTNYLFKYIKVSQKLANLLYKLKLPIYKKFRGMSTKEVQKKWGKLNLTSSEGVVRYRKVEYTLSQWVNNFDDYLRSSMSYCGASELNEFIGVAKTNRITNNSHKRYNK
jgi:IMP dehydrogenase/GMP reductase